MTAQRGPNLGRAEPQDRERDEVAEIAERPGVTEALHELTTALTQMDPVRRVLTGGYLTAMLEMAFEHA